MAQQSNNSKSSALLKDQVMLLLDLISSHKVITTKATNATNNKLKEDAWKSIAEVFNANTGVPRRPEQLRLKWENLKKAARKRNTFIRQNNLKTGGGKTQVLPDEALDRVASMLGATCTGFTVEFGGDKENIEEPNIGAEAVANIVDFEPLPEIIETEKRDFYFELDADDNSGVVVSSVGTGGGMGVIGGHTLLFHFFFTVNRKRKLSDEVQMAKRDKDLALSEYFKAKAERIKIENEKLKLENEKLKLEMEKSLSEV